MARPVVAFGDWHGNEYWAVKKLYDSFIRFPEARLVHVGDFGFWDTDVFTQQYMKDAEEKDGVLAPSQPEHFQGYVWEVEKTLAKNNQVLYVVLGNHENYWEIDQTFGYLGFMSDELRQYNSLFSSQGHKGRFVRVRSDLRILSRTRTDLSCLNSSRISALPLVPTHGSGMECRMRR